MEETRRPKVSVLTPTWNRAAYLERVWGSLDRQTYRDFEWLIADDCSTDETESMVRALAKRSEFQIVFISANVHIGKARMDNELISRARGEFIVWNDSDDYLMPNAIQRFLGTWETIPFDERDNFVGVTALAADQSGILLKGLPVSNCIDTTWNELSYRYRVTGDKSIFIRASVLKQHRFLEVDFVVPEGSLWSAIGDLKTRLIPEVLLVKEYQAPYCISFSKSIKYARGYAFAYALSERNTKHHKKHLATKLFKLISYARYSVHGEIPLSTTRNLWPILSDFLLLILVYPIGIAFAIRDIVLGKVIKTHREFDTAVMDVKINTEYLSTQTGTGTG